MLKKVYVLFQLSPNVAHKSEDEHGHNPSPTIHEKLPHCHTMAPSSDGIYHPGH